jgi:hypothetical protein
MMVVRFFIGVSIARDAIRGDRACKMESSAERTAEGAVSVSAAEILNYDFTVARFGWSAPLSMQ